MSSEDQALATEQQRKRDKPVLSNDQAIATIESLFALQVDPSSVKELDSYDDKNFYFRASGDLANESDCNAVAASGGDQNEDEEKGEPAKTTLMYHFLLKVHNGVESAQPDFIIAQNDAMALLRQTHEASGCHGYSWTPRALPARDGKLISFLPNGQVVSGERKPLAARLLPFKPGKVLGSVPPNPALLQEVGQLCAHVTLALPEFHSEACHRPTFTWDLRQAMSVQPHVPLLEQTRREVVSGVFDELQRSIFAPESGVQDKLRMGVIHGDINDQNILIKQKASTDGEGTGGGWEVTGLLDLGDMCHSWIVGDIAIAAAYAVISLHYPGNKPQEGNDQRKMMSEFEVASEVVAGYCARAKGTPAELQDIEFDVLPILIATRISVSLTLGTYSSSKDPENEYLKLTLEPGWAALQAWRQMPSKECAELLRSKS